MSRIWPVIAAAVAILFIAAGPAIAQRPDPDPGGFDDARRRFDPAADDPAVLARMARVASESGQLPRFRAVLDSVVGAGAAGPNALSYWGALSLQAGGAPDSVAVAFGRYLEESGEDLGALVGFFRVLEAHGAHAAAGALLDRAEARGAPPAALAGMRGEAREALGDAAGALNGYLAAIRAVGSGGVTAAAVTAAARIDALLDRWPEARSGSPASSPPGASLAAAAERLEAVLREELPASARRLVVPLLVKARLGAGDWAAAGRAARDPSLDGQATGNLLRSVAAAARAGGDPAAAESALEQLLSLGPPAAHPSDRLLLADAARERGDTAAAAAELRRAEAAGVPGAGERILLDEVAAARDAGDPARLARALGRARQGDVGAARIGVAEGDLHLARGAPDSALAAYGRSAGDEAVGPTAIEALARARLVQWLLRAGVSAATYGSLGRTLVAAPPAPAAAAARLDSLALVAFGPGASRPAQARAAPAAEAGAAGPPVGPMDAPVEVARSLLLGLAAEWRGRAGDAAGASRALERAAARPGAGAEAPGLLLAAGLWARTAGDEERAGEIWRALVRDHAGSAYALEARRLLRDGGPPDPDDGGGSEPGQDAPGG